MSVINKVLKDLDKQKSATTQDSGSASKANTDSSAETGFVKPEVQFISQVQSDSSDEHSRKGIYISIAMLIAVAVFAVMFYRQGLQLKKLQPLAETKQAKAVNVKPIDSNVVQTSNTDLSLDNNAESLQLEANADSPEAVTFSDSASNSNNRLESESISDVTSPEASNIALTDKPLSEQNELTQVSEIKGTELTAAEPKAQSQPRVLKVDSKMAAITESTALKPSTASNDSSTVQVRFSQNTRTSTIVDDVKSEVKTESQNSVIKSSESGAIKSTKGAMAVKEVVLTDTELAQKKFEIAEVAEQQQKIDKAVKYYYEALMLDPAMHKARKQLASLYYALNNLGRAEQILAQGVAQFPEEVELAILKAKVENASFSPIKALTTLDGVSDSSDWARDKWILQSDIAQKNGRFELAESAYRSLITVEPSQARWWMGLAYALDSQQQYPQAADAYRKALSYRGLSTGAMTYIEQRLIQLGGSQ
ncbi:tetratricopeptide repeat protein [Shewanella goraebulensis]|uniref:tetratricopeptide repeat protein n=1 Tax=Shewanella goraebulensis TaxID=3050637 RepID=UPI00254D67EF|nr:tetratricopeptide repeat protein [Shewanella goraebulensis]